MYYPNSQNNNFGSTSSGSSESTLRSRLIQGIVDVIGIIITFIAFAIVYAVMDPKIRYYTCDQSDVSYPYIADTVPFYAVGLFGVIGVLVVILLVELYNAKLFPLQSSDDELGSRLRIFYIVLFHSISLFVFGIAVTLLLTEIGKRWAGRLRPHFIAVCNPTTLTSAVCSTNGVYNSIYTGGSFCTGSASSVKEARLSFPSGHSSFSVYTMLFLVIYLQARLNTLTFRAIRPLIQVAAISAAWIVCLSRIVDYHHRGSDVIGGAILGALVALAFTLLFGRVLWQFSKRKEEDFDFRDD